MQLKKTQGFPPEGWTFFDPDTGWRAPRPLSETFEETVATIINYRKLNRGHFTKSTDFATVAEELANWTCTRLAGNKEWCGGVVNGVKKKPPQAPSRWAAALAKLAAVTKEISGGIETLKDWVGEGGKPVSQERADSRAATCVRCPLNDRSEGWWSSFKGDVAEAIRSQMAVKTGASLATSKDNSLGICGACGCHLPLKVWVPLRHILDNTSPEVEAKLDGGCWIKHESSQRLLVVIPFCTKDYSQAVDLIEWIGQLGGCQDNELLLVSDPRVSVNQRSTIVDSAKTLFKDVKLLVTPPNTPSGWPAGPNAMWRATLMHVETVIKQPFYWMEPDCIPLRAGWLSELESEYFSCGQPFMGALVHSSGQANLPADHLTGCAIYPADAHSRLRSIYHNPQAFDMAMASLVVPHTHHTNLHYHFWGGHGLPPTFKITREKGDKNTLLIDGIPKDCATYHRNKDGSLIRLLRSQLNVD